MSNSSILDDLRYIAEAFMGEARSQCEADLRQFASGLIGAGISPPVALSDQQLISDYLAARHLVDYGIPISPPAKKTAPVLGGSGATLVGITTRKPNFDLTGAKLVKRGVARNCGERHAQRADAGLREAHPVGNTGITLLLELASV